MEINNTFIIKPSIDTPSVIKKLILYPHYLSEVMVSIPRAIGRPRRFKLFLLVDGCTGKVLRCDSWPNLQTEAFAYESVPPKITDEEAKIVTKEYAKIKIARRYMTYWNPIIEIIRFNKVHKIFWMMDAKCAIDSISAGRLIFN